MKSMFDSYDNPEKELNNEPEQCPAPELKPNNKTPLRPSKPMKPYEEYNAEGELVAFWWNYGNTVNLEFELSGYVTVDEDDTYVDVRDFIKDKKILIQLYNFRHEELVNKWYNGEDYQVINYSEDKKVHNKTRGVYYVQSIDEQGVVTYTPVDLPKDFIQGTVYFKQDDIRIIFPIDEKLSKKLLRGVYYCSLSVIGDDFMHTLFYQNECTLEVK